MRDVVADLLRLTPTIDEIRKVSCTLGLSVGVLHQGHVVYKSHFGQREVTKPDPPDDDTMYFVASLTKAVAAAALAILVERGDLDWETPVSAYLPELIQRNDRIGRDATLVDFLSHRTGLPSMSPFWVQRRQRAMMPKADVIKTVVNSKAVAPFRERFIYSNWGYGLMDHVIERRSGQSLSDFFVDNIIEPLSLQRTTIKVPNTTNVTSVNSVRDDGTICSLELPPQSNETGLACAAALKSSLSDLLKLYQALLVAYKAEKEGHNTTTPTPFRQVSKLFESQMPLGDVDASEDGYALGWVNATLPHRLGTTSMNAVYMGGASLPVIGNETPGVRVLLHHGSLFGALSSVHLVPDTDTAIVVLANTLGCSDTADWVGQLLLQTVIRDTPLDYVEWTQRSEKALLDKYSETIKQVEAGRTEGPPSKDLEAYCGHFVNGPGTFFVDIALLDGSKPGLRMNVQGFDDVMYELFPYAGDTFYWPCDRETEMCQEMMFPWTDVGIHQILFNIDSDGAVDRLSWELSDAVGLEVFYRRSK